MRYRLWATLLQWLQSWCRHGSNGVIADYLEGDMPGTQIRWCRRCGAIRRVPTTLFVDYWDMPEPDGYKDDGHETTTFSK